jgi:alternate signal-mediated exported protein
MNAFLKAALAAAAGSALFLGGAGTLALWNSSSSIRGGQITAGELTVGTASTGLWSVAHETAGSYAAPVSLSAAEFAHFRAVPGDRLVFTTTVPITATGDNLTATTSLSEGAVMPSTSSAADRALASTLTGSAMTTLSLPGGPGVTGGTPNYTLVPNGARISAVATLTATIIFPVGAANAYAGVNGSVSFANMGVAVTQTS